MSDKLMPEPVEEPRDAATSGSQPAPGCCRDRIAVPPLSEPSSWISFVVLNLALFTTACTGLSWREEPIRSVPCDRVMGPARDALAKARKVEPGQSIGYVRLWYERAVDCNPFDPEAWEGRSEVARMTGKSLFATRYMQRAQELRAQIARQGAPAYTALSAREQEVVNLSDRIQAERKAEHSHAIARALAQRAWAHDALGHQDLALADFAAAIAEDPNYASEAYRDRAKYYQRHNLADLATRDTQQADAREPQENKARLRGIKEGFRESDERMAQVRDALAQRLKTDQAEAEFLNPDPFRPAREALDRSLDMVRVETLERCGYRMGPLQTGPAGKESNANAIVFILIDRVDHRTPVGVEVVQVGLPMEISQELLSQIERRGIKIGMKLDLPFFVWLLHVHQSDFRGYHAFTGWAGNYQGDLLTGCGWADWSGAGLAGATLTGLVTMLRDNRLVEIQGLIREYLNSTSFAPEAPGRPAAQWGRQP